MPGVAALQCKHRGDIQLAALVCRRAGDCPISFPLGESIYELEVTVQNNGQYLSIDAVQASESPQRVTDGLHRTIRRARTTTATKPFSMYSLEELICRQPELLPPPLYVHP